MPTKGQRARAATQGTAATAAPYLNYYGGPVVSGARVHSVLWGGSSGDYLPQVAGTASPNMDGFFGHVGNSAYLSWLGEYDGTDQQIGYGAFSGRTAIAPSASANGSTVSDTAIRNELLAQITAGHLPAPAVDSSGDTTTIYALFFRKGTTICFGSDCSGVAFCAYHETMSATINGTSRDLLYMVLPDTQSAAMLSGCGSASATNAFAVAQSDASHELVETITDPDVGLASSFAPPLGWYDPVNGEIADICVSTLADPNGTETGTDGVTYVVQKEWSNARNTCIVDEGSTVPSAPGSPAAAAQPSGKVRVSWAAPTSDGGSGVTAYDVYESTTGGLLGARVASVGASSTVWASGSLTNGASYYFEVVARNINGAGPASTQVSAVADASAPVVTVTSPSTLFQLGTAVTVRYGASDTVSGVASYDVQYRAASWNSGFGGYTTVSSATTATSRSMTGAPGREYCFHVRARDRAGNVSAWSADRCAVLPVDDRSLTTATSGWSRTLSSAAYRGTLTRTATVGAKLQLTGAQLDRVALVVTECATCGSVGVYVNGALWHTVGAASSTTRYEVILLPGTFSLRTATIMLRSMTSGRQLIVDGLGIART